MEGEIRASVVWLNGGVNEYCGSGATHHSYHRGSVVITGAPQESIYPLQLSPGIFTVQRYNRSEWRDNQV
jgi:hypothetical protein